MEALSLFFLLALCWAFGKMRRDTRAENRDIDILNRKGRL